MDIDDYETIIWEEKMKAQILSHARILYAEKITPTSILDVISTQRSRESLTTYTSYVIMIEAPGSTVYQPLLRTNRKESVGRRLEDSAAYLAREAG